MKMLLKYIILNLFLAVSTLQIFAQDKAYIYGKISDTSSKAAENVNIYIEDSKYSTVSDSKGNYELGIPAGKQITVTFSHVGFRTKTQTFYLISGERKSFDVVLTSSSKTLETIDIYGNGNRDVTIIRIPVKYAGVIPAPSGDAINALIQQMSLNAHSNNELSSQYSVRGGNFDENLVYVNDVEIYRPLLQQSGQQEGLSFVNSDLTSNVVFSSGGFDAKYGDKMSSVLDVQYKRPEQWGASAMLSLLGASGHLEGSADSGRFTFLLGVRQKSNQYILNSLSTKGQYKPSFTDVQFYTTYKISKKVEITLLGNYAYNKYLVIPESRESQFGTIQETYKLRIDFEGRELDKINTYLGAGTVIYKPNNNLYFKWINAGYQTHETQTEDIMGQYLIGRLENDMGDENYGQMKDILGIGKHLTHTRDDLRAIVWSSEIKGGYFKSNKNNWLFGIKYQNEIIKDKLKEWEMIDSSDYTLPHFSDSVGYTNPGIQGYSPILMSDLVNNSVSLNSNRISGFVQNTWKFQHDSTELGLTAGLRFTYWDLNNQVNVSPRLTLTINPKRWRKDVIFRISTGVYHQPPFYKELKRFDGTINEDVKAQRAIHLLAGADMNFKLWDRPFKFVTEIYYKKLDNIVPYEIDNVKIQYFANNSSKGYTIGLDMKIFGEFVKGDESWFGISLMQSREKITGESYYVFYDKDGNTVIPGYSSNPATDSILRTPGYVPRPTDQLLTFNIFFQDHFPRWPNFKIHLNLVYASPLPFGPADHSRYKDTLRMPAYFRADIGFSKAIIPEEESRSGTKHRFVKSLWISAEVFNLFGRINTISYLWVKDVNNRQYAVPNELTSRLVNVKLIARF